MVDNWFCKVGDRQFGPLPMQRIKFMAARGQIDGASLVRCGATGAWLPASQFPGILPPASNGARASPLAPPPAALKTPPPLPGAARQASSVSAEPEAPPIAVPLPAPPVASAPPVVASALPPSSEPAPPLDAAQGPSSALLLTIVGGAAAVVLLAVGVVGAVVYWQYLTTPSVATRLDSDSDNRPSEANPDEAEPDAVDNKPEPVIFLTDEEAVQSIDEWRKTSIRIVSKNSEPKFSLQILGASLGADLVPHEPPVATAPVAKPVRDQVLDLKELGVTRRRTDARGRILDDVEPSQPSSAAPSSAAGSASADAPPKYVFVQLQLVNLDHEQELNYSGWNSETPPPDRPRAVLVDSAGCSCRLLSVSEAPAPGRLSSVNIAAHESVTDLLVFAAPAEPYDYVRLVLPWSTIGGKGYVGYEISRAELSSPRGRLVGTAELPSDAIERGIEELDQSAAGAGATQDAPPINRPPSIEEINRALEAYDKPGER